MQAWTLANCTAVAVYCSITTSDVQERLSAQIDVQLQGEKFIEEEEARFSRAEYKRDR